MILFIKYCGLWFIELRVRLMCMMQGELKTGIFLDPAIVHDGQSPHAS